MEHLSHRVDPRFLSSLAEVLVAGPLTELEVHDLFLRDVPNRNLSLRVLRTLRDCAIKGGVLAQDGDVWRLSGGRTEQLIRECLAVWAAPDFNADALFRSRSAVCLGHGILSAQAEYSPLHELAARTSLSAVEWARLVSGSCDLRLLTGRVSKHVEADSLMLYRNADTPPISDAADVVPRLERRLLPTLPASHAALQESIVSLRNSWRAQLGDFLGYLSVADFGRFILYAKDLLDFFLWGRSTPLRSTVAIEDLPRLSLRAQRYGLRTEDFRIAWRSIPNIYRMISRLSWGERYLSNNLSNPRPPAPDAKAFLRVCNMPAPMQSAISSARTGQSLLTLARSLRVLHRALAEWQGRPPMISGCAACAAAVAGDHQDDKLQRRSLAERIRRLQVVPPVYLLDAFAQTLSPPSVIITSDPALDAAGIISVYSNFIESPQGHAYAEIRLSLHSELDFKGRFNVHSLSPHKRYEGVWDLTLTELVARVEDARSANLRRSYSAMPPA